MNLIILDKIHRRLSVIDKCPLRENYSLHPPKKRSDNQVLRKALKEQPSVMVTTSDKTNIESIG